jgi:hypothetical protein
MGAVIGLIYVVGWLGSVMVGRSRAGLTQVGRLSLATMFSSFGWFMHQIASMLLWPVFLAVWLIRGRPDSPWHSEITPQGTLRVVRSR